MNLHECRVIRLALVLILAAWLGMITACSGGGSTGKSGEQRPATDSQKPCLNCAGSGIVTSFQQAPFDPNRPGSGGGQFVTNVCPLCGGSGKAR